VVKIGKKEKDQEVKRKESVFETLEKVEKNEKNEKNKKKLYYNYCIIKFLGELGFVFNGVCIYDYIFLNNILCIYICNYVY